MRYLASKKNKIRKLYKTNLESENIELKRKIELLKKYISQSSIFNKVLQVELFERSEELENHKAKFDDEEQIM